LLLITKQIIKGKIMYETYGESLQDAGTITQVRAIKEVKNHGVMVDEFFIDLGVKDSYTGAELAEWLGY
jgi:hypothetical protein